MAAGGLSSPFSVDALSRRRRRLIMRGGFFESSATVAFFSFGCEHFFVTFRRTLVRARDTPFPFFSRIFESLEWILFFFRRAATSCYVP